MSMGGSMEHDETAPEPEELALVERLWRSGTSAVAVSPSTREDHRILTRLLTSDDRSQAVPMLRRHRVATWRYASVVTLHVGRADAAVEATWRELLGEQGTVIGRWTNLRAWLFGVTRRHARDTETPAGDDLDLDADTSAMPFDPTGDIALLAAAFSLLDEPARTAVWLHAVEGFDDSDVAHVLDISVLDAHDLTEAAMGELHDGAVRGMRSTASARCAPVIEAFDSYLDLSLDADDEIALLAHLDRCRRCSARLDAVEAPGLSLIDRVLAPPTTLTARLRSLAAAR